VQAWTVLHTCYCLCPARNAQTQWVSRERSDSVIWKDDRGRRFWNSDFCTTAPAGTACRSAHHRLCSSCTAPDHRVISTCVQHILSFNQQQPAGSSSLASSTLGSCISSLHFYQEIRSNPVSQGRCPMCCSASGGAPL
jgi:hypothetical protein